LRRADPLGYFQLRANAEALDAGPLTCIKPYSLIACKSGYFLVCLFQCNYPRWRFVLIRIFQYFVFEFILVVNLYIIHGSLQRGNHDLQEIAAANDWHRTDPLLPGWVQWYSCGTHAAPAIQYTPAYIHIHANHHPFTYFLTYFHACANSPNADSSTPC
jgi:hypothetical protein